MKRIIFTVTTDLTYDQRMIRICTTLAGAGYDVLLVGRKQRSSIPLVKRNYTQKRLHPFFEKGKLFYAFYNIRLFIFLLFTKADAICAVDLDTILPCYYVSKIKKVKRIYDAHELFCEMKEIVTRPKIYRAWKWIERKTVPHFTFGYTVNEPIAKEYEKMYGIRYEVIRNVPMYNAALAQTTKEKYILYQGAVNEGRCFETIIPAMKLVEAKLIVCGDGNFMRQAKALVKQYGLEEKIVFTGMLAPALLQQYSAKAYIGINIIENNGLSYYLSLANRFFDLIQAGVPQVCVGYPAYKRLNDEYNIAVLIDDVSAETIAANINRLLQNETLWQKLHINTLAGAQVLNWQEEEKKLISFYKNIVG